MSTTIGGLFQANAQRKQQQAQAKIAWAQSAMTREIGAAQKRKAYADATMTEQAEKQNAGLRGQQMRQMRKKQTAAAGAAEAAAAGSGFDVSSGSGKMARESAVQEFDAVIGNMAQSSSISSINAAQRALDLRREGNMAQRLANIEAIGTDWEARALQDAARQTKKGMLTGAIASGVGAIAGGIFGGVMGAEAGGNLGWNLGAGFNTQTSQFTTGFGSLSSLLTSFTGGGGGGWSSMQPAQTASGSAYTPDGWGGWQDTSGFTGFRRY